MHTHICCAGKELFLSQLRPLILCSLCFSLLRSHHRDDVIAMLPCQLALILSNGVEGISTTIFFDPEWPHHYIMPFTYTATKRQSHKLVFTQSPLEPYSIVWMHCHNLGGAQKYHPVSEQVVYFLSDLLALDVDEAERMEHRLYKKINTHVND